MSRVSMQEVRATYKVRDSWWTVLLVDPVAGRLAQLAAGHRWLTPNRLTVAAFLLGLAAAGAFLAGSPGWLVAGALLYHVGFVIDCVDGKLARLTGNGSVFGGWLDFVCDRLRVVICVMALFAGQFARTERPVYLFVATGVVFLALFGYVNGAETDKARAQLTGGGPASAREDDLPGAAGRLQQALHRRRVRLNLVSGIEFEMAVLVVAPLVVAATAPTGLLVVTAVGAGLLIGFELLLIARFWLATRRAGPPARRVANQPGPAEVGSPEPESAATGPAPQQR